MLADLSCANALRTLQIAPNHDFVLAACAVCLCCVHVAALVCHDFVLIAAGAQPNVPDLVPMTLCSMMVPVVLRCCSALPALPLHPHLPSLHETHVSSRVVVVSVPSGLVDPRLPDGSEGFCRCVLSQPLVRQRCISYNASMTLTGNRR